VVDVGVGVSGSAPGIVCVFCAKGLVAPCDRDLSCSRWSSFLAGGELLFAWFRRSSAALSLASSASSSLVCVLTACFLRACQSGPRRGEYGRSLLFEHRLVQVLQPAVEVEQAVEFRHEVARYRPTARGQSQTGGSYASAGRAHD
jgi:hypothetical protein